MGIRFSLRRVPYGFLAIFFYGVELLIASAQMHASPLPPNGVSPSEK